ncbi:MAG: CYTH domain-containing protein [Nevskiales bacterium]|nr:CYTH domain-containing protein [Nevskiales bacterium]
MGIEIERKFRVKNEHWRASVVRSLPMRQGYLSDGSGRASVRVRLEGERAVLGIKAAIVGHTRTEYGYAIPSGDAREILEQLCVGVLEKIRHWVVHAGNTWEVDEFTGANGGLVVAEIELTHADQSLERPDWLGEEVTGDRRYYNQQLALHPYSDWHRP